MSDKVEKQAQYEKLKKRLHSAILEKKIVDRQLTQIEEDIFSKESLYLTNTMHHSYGNIIKGFDTFVRSSGQSVPGSSRRRTSMTDDDRIFSLSSAIYVKHLQKKNREEEEEDEEEEEETGRKRR